MDNESRIILLNKKQSFLQQSQAASICGFDIAAKELLEIANSITC
jgi:hypothetical protein